MNIEIYYDIENLGANCDMAFIYEQLLFELGVSNTYNHYAYYDWDSYAESYETYNSLMIKCISINDSSKNNKIKNLADIKMSVDIALNSLEQNEITVVIVSGDAHFLTIVNALKARAVQVYIAAYEKSCSKDLRKCSDKYIPIISQRPKGQDRTLYSTILRLYNNYIEYSNSFALFNSVIDIIGFYAKTKFEKDGITLSKLQSLISNYGDINIRTSGYKNASDFARAATSETDYCVARCENEHKSYTVKIFKRGFVEEGYTELPPLQKVNVNSKEHYCNITKLPQGFNIKTMKRVLNKIRVNLDDLPEIIDYLAAMKNIGIISEEDKKLKIIRNNYFNTVVKAYVRNKVQEEGIQVDETIIDEFVL